jgi:hypothetical protein
MDLEEDFLRAFDRKMLKQVRLNVLFFLAAALELIAFFLFLPFFIQNAFVALALAAFILTLFSYAMLKQYIDVQKEAFFDQMIDGLESQSASQSSREALERHTACASLFCRLADRLYQREYCLYRLPKAFSFLTPWMKKLSCLLHWKDVHLIREKLLQASVNEHLKIVRAQPTDRDAHALLANAYVMLSGLYLDPRMVNNDEGEEWIPTGKYGASFKAKFEDAAQKAVEEFKILNEYAPKDPWVYMQLAYSFRDLHRTKDEKAAYEAILALCPHDHETRFKLGALCFQQGENAKGLRIYEELKKAQYPKADDLLVNYGVRAIYE